MLLGNCLFEVKGVFNFEVCYIYSLLFTLMFYLDFPSLAEVALAERDFLPVSVVDFDTICKLTVFSYCLLIKIHTSL